MKNDITVTLTTCDRYTTTLPLCLLSIINQTILPKCIILVDDSKEKSFYKHDIIKNILNLIKIKNINFEYYEGQYNGKVYAQKISFDKVKTDWFFSTDDDNILEPNVIELLIKNIKDNIGAISGLILSKKDIQSNRKIQYQSLDRYNKMEDLFRYFNIQMCPNQDNKIKKVEHIYSNYLTKKEYIKYHPLEFSPSSHREETVITYEIFRQGYDLIIDPKIKIWHLDEQIGGNRLHKLDNKNDILFMEKLKEWNINLDIDENENMVYQKIENGPMCLVYMKK